MVFRGVRCRVALPVGAFICSYNGELISEDIACVRGVHYDHTLGMSYLFDLRDISLLLDHGGDMGAESDGGTGDRPAPGNGSGSKTAGRKRGGGKAGGSKGHVNAQNGSKSSAGVGGRKSPGKATATASKVDPSGADAPEHMNLMAIDATLSGNVARFINHVSEARFPFD